MKRFHLLSLTCLAACLVPAVAQAAPGDLDTSFDGDGKVTTDFGGDVQGEILSAAIDSHGRIVAAGSSGSIHGGPLNFTLARYRSDGSLDPSFGNGGIVTTAVQGPAFSVTIDRHGRIVAAGATRFGFGDSDFVVARYHADGSPDASFGADGEVTTDFGGLDYAGSVAIDSRGRIIAAGQRGLGRGWWVLARYTSDGHLDPSFAGDGKAITGFGPEGARARATSAVVDSRNRVFVGGYLYGSVPDDFALVRYSARGVISARSFGTDGKVITDLGGNDYAYGAAIDPIGRVVVCGNSDGDFALARYHADGSLDRTFAGDGRVTTDLGAYGAADDIAIDSEGRIAAVGYRDTEGEDHSEFAAARYRPGGGLDTSFGDGGKVTTDFGADTLDEASSVVIDSQERIAAAGYRSGDFALVRYLGQ